jgi:hypothetical protein
MRALAILCVKNEGAFLLEWLAHHRATGFTDFLVFSNDCSDGSELMLDRLAAMGWLTHIRNDGEAEEGPQWAALKTADKHPLMRLADWVLVLDIDEFVNIHAGARRLPDLLAALPDATAIPLTWRMFGNAGILRYADAPVRQTFTRAAPAVIGWPWRAQLFKTLFRNDGSYRKLGVHRPRSPAPARMAAQRWCDGSGRALPDSYHTGRIFSDYSRNNYGLVQLNHYALGAMESYLLKCDRGRANREGAGLDMGYWVDRNFSAVEDRSILSLPVTDLLAELHADPVLSDLHRRAVGWRMARIAALMQQEPWRAFLGRLMMTPASRTLTQQEAKAIFAYQIKADSEDAAPGQ